VIPLWIEQIQSGRPITITVPSMTRFMMTLEDAVDLVLHAFQCGVNGDLFVQKAPAATMEVLSSALLRLFSCTQEPVVIGSRHGEKLYETLVTHEEMSKAVDEGRYYRIPCDARDLNYAKTVAEGIVTFTNALDYNSHNTRLLSVDEMIEMLLRVDYVKTALSAR
jgi:UDP-N-acetylglucosamine 4,6-dehydratase